MGMRASYLHGACAVMLDARTAILTMTFDAQPQVRDSHLQAI